MSITLTGLSLITRSLQTLGVLDPYETPSSADADTALQVLQETVDAWNTQALTVLVVDRHVFSLTSGKGGPDNPYTLGPGGDWDTGTAARPMSIETANLILNTTTPAVEVPLPIITDDAFAAIQIKGLSNAQPTTFYYNQTSPLATCILWPVTSNATNEIALYYDLLTPNFSTLAASYVCPPGYAAAFRLALAHGLVPYFAVAPEKAMWVEREAERTLNDIKMANFKMDDLAMDPALTPDPHGSYNILTDQGA